ncbi:hypothetical protein EPA93_32155 [Ktedonosporobacter rubrisoli]|uniref:Uncharacterized protein n=1 Tax=Ktedonosporobacter rubrisoli TaxID=2509675 RepID=A0A4P6JZ67_KTERU|nr:hypothetical protein [Ktedonosporobacter rubrisoli]QBD80376.1 hypothetical protein EPA93_32155 [Ktedonosporobacter rubrisoli]
MSERCRHLRRLHASLTHEITVLQETLQEEEGIGSENPIEIRNILKSLQDTLQATNVELQKCPPPEENELPS